MPRSSRTRLVRLSERSAERDLGGDDPISLQTPLSQKVVPPFLYRFLFNFLNE